MDEKMQDMCTEAYHYGWAHAIEEVVKNIYLIKKDKINFPIQEEYRAGFDVFIERLADSLMGYAKDTKNH